MFRDGDRSHKTQEGVVETVFGFGPFDLRQIRLRADQRFECGNQIGQDFAQRAERFEQFLFPGYQKLLIFSQEQIAEPAECLDDA